jgi:isopenicillin N synthase-like dioxygenase
MEKNNTQNMESYGFFYVPYDEKDVHIISDMFDYTKYYFNLPEHIKYMDYKDNQHFGYIPLIKKNTETNESYVYVNNDSLHKYHEIFSDYCNLVSTIAKKIFLNILNNLNIDDVYIKYLTEKPFEALRLIHYPLTNNNTSICGCKEHTDWGYLALLITDSEGLQIKTTDGWIDVPNKSNHFIVNIGDMLEIISNKKYKSTIHRVITTEEKYSVVFFFEPSESCVIKTLDGKDFVYGDYLRRKIMESDFYG